MAQQFLKFKWVSIAFLVSFALILSGFLWAYFSLRGIEQPLILHFNAAQGITWRGGISHLAAIASAALIAVGMDFLLAFELARKDWFWGRCIAGVALFLSVLMFWYFWGIIAVN